MTEKNNSRCRTHRIGSSDSKRVDRDSPQAIVRPACRLGREDKAPFLGWYLRVHLLKGGLRRDDSTFKHQDRLYDSVSTLADDALHGNRVDYPATPAAPSKWPVDALIVPT